MMMTATSSETQRDILLQSLNDYFYENQDAKPYFRSCLKLYPAESSLSYAHFVDPDEERRLLLQEAKPEYHFLE